MRLTIKRFDGNQIFTQKQIGTGHYGEVIHRDGGRQETLVLEEARIVFLFYLNRIDKRNISINTLTN